MLQPRRHQIQESITSLEVTFKKVTFKVLMNSCSLGATRTLARVQSTSAPERHRLGISFLLVPVSTGSSGAWDCMGTTKLWDTLINICGCFVPVFSSFYSIFTPGTQTPAMPPPCADGDWLALIQGSNRENQSRRERLPGPVGPVSTFQTHPDTRWHGSTSSPWCPRAGL